MKTEQKEKIIKQYFAEISKMGGMALLKKRGKEYYSMIGKKGGKTRGEQMRKNAAKNRT